MPICQYKNIINSRKGKMAPPEPSYPMTARPERAKMAKAHENYLNSNNFMKIIEILKEKMKKYLKN